MSGRMGSPTYEAEILRLHASCSLTTTGILSVLRICMDKKLFRTPRLLIINHLYGYGADPRRAVEGKRDIP